MFAADDFGSGFPGWVQLSAVAVLVVLMLVALRLLFVRLSRAYDREVERANAAEGERDARYAVQITELVTRLEELIADVRRMLDRGR